VEIRLDEVSMLRLHVGPQDDSMTRFLFVTDWTGRVSVFWLSSNKQFEKFYE
jgi:hypothetical protein